MRALDFLKRPRIEALALRGYRHERISDLTLPIASGLMEGGFIGVIADKLFSVHPAVLALISAAPMFGNLSSFFWARIAHGRRKIPLIVGLQAAFVGLVAAVALVPSGAAGAWVLVATLVASRLVLGGVVTVRSLVWTLNYPRETRSRVTARLSVIFTLTVTLTAAIGSGILDRDPQNFRALYAVGALLAAVGVFAFSRVPVIGEAQQLQLERAGVELDVHAASDGPAAPQPARARESMLGVLRADRLYTRYLSWQFLLGVSNMMVEPPLIYLVSRQLQASYTEAIAITVVIPFAFAVVAVPLWAPYLDRVHIVHYRSRHSWFFAGAQLLLWIGALQGSLALIALSRVIGGVARGGGMIAWQLGHNDFADQQRVGLYMGVHVTLTGLRGLIAPFAGTLLYLGWSARGLPGSSLSLPGFDGLGAQLMVLGCILSVIACLGFRALDRSIESQGARAGGS